MALHERFSYNFASFDLELAVGAWVGQKVLDACHYVWALWGPAGCRSGDRGSAAQQRRVAGAATWERTRIRTIVPASVGHQPCSWSTTSGSFQPGEPRALVRIEGAARRSSALGRARAGARQGPGKSVGCRGGSVNPLADRRETRAKGCSTRVPRTGRSRLPGSWRQRPRNGRADARYQACEGTGGFGES